MLNISIYERQLVGLGFEAFAEFDVALHKAGGTTELYPELRSEVVERESVAVRRLIIVHDALAQLTLGDISQAEAPDNLPILWANDARRTSRAYVQRLRVDKQLSRITLLSVKHASKQTALWRDARRELFKENKDYHGKRFGVYYAVAIATGKLAFREYAASGLSNREAA